MDLVQLYHAFSYAGCRAGLQQTPYPRADGSTEYYIGCLLRPGGGCTGQCNQCLQGIQVGRQMFRWAVPHFSNSLAGNSLDGITCHVVRLWRTRGVHVIWHVDDAGFLFKNACPDPRTRTCKGPEQCHLCQTSLAEANSTFIELKQEMLDLGLILSKKSSPPSQQGVFLGIQYDTRLGTWSIPDSW
eukprot:632416-Rhodomonas_salina.1